LLKAAQAALTELPMVKAASGLRPLVPPMVMSEPRRACSQAGIAIRWWWFVLTHPAIEVHQDSP